MALRTKIAVLLPVYNAEKFLRECLDSIVKQTLSDFVLFACDDKSTDGSLGILNEYASNDTRIRILKNSDNIGVVATLNHLLSVLPEETEFVARIDADDVMFPDRLQKQLTFLTEHPEIGGVGSSLEIIDENSHVIGFRHYPETADAIRRAMLYQNVLAHPAMMLRSSIIRKTGWYSDSCMFCEDYDYWLRAMEYTDFANLSNPVLKYRISSSQIKSTKLKLTLLSQMRIQRDHCRRMGKRMPFPLVCRQIAGYLLLCLPSAWILKLFYFLTYRKGEMR